VLLGVQQRLEPGALPRGRRRRRGQDPAAAVRGGGGAAAARPRADARLGPGHGGRLKNTAPGFSPRAVGGATGAAGEVVPDGGRGVRRRPLAGAAARRAAVDARARRPAARPALQVRAAQSLPRAAPAAAAAARREDGRRPAGVVAARRGRGRHQGEDAGRLARGRDENRREPHAVRVDHSAQVRGREVRRPATGCSRRGGVGVDGCGRHAHFTCLFWFIVRDP